MFIGYFLVIFARAQNVLPGDGGFVPTFDRLSQEQRAQTMRMFIQFYNQGNWVKRSVLIVYNLIRLYHS